MKNLIFIFLLLPFSGLTQETEIKFTVPGATEGAYLSFTDYILSHEKKDSVVYIHEGSYDVGEGIWIDQTNDIYIWAHPEAKEAPSFVNKRGESVFEISGSSNIELKGLKLLVEDPKEEYLFGAAIAISTCTKVRILDCDLSGDHYGLKFSGSESVLVSNNYFHDYGKGAILTWDAADNTLIIDGDKELPDNCSISNNRINQ